MNVIPQHKIVALERTPEGSWCSSSREGAGKQGETEVAPSAGEVLYLLCRWCRKASKSPREGSRS